MPARASDQSANPPPARKEPAAHPTPPPAALPSRLLPTGGWPHLTLVLLLLATCATLAIASLVRDSVTFDETSHLTAGVSYVHTADYRLAPDHPPLAKLWCALPILLSNYQWPTPDNEHWLSANVFQFGRHWLFHLNDGQQLVIRGRMMMVCVLLALCGTVYATARTLIGPQAGLLALLLACFSPTLLAHGRLITTDVPIALCLMLALLTFARLMQRGTWPALLAAAGALAAASVTKMSWPLILPALVAMAIHALLQRPRPAPADANKTQKPPQSRLATVVGAAIALTLATYAGIWTTYGWRDTIVAPLPADEATPAAVEHFERSVNHLTRQWVGMLRDADGTPKSGPIPSFLRYAAEHSLLPEAYVYGLAMTFQSTEARSAYLLGEYSNEGWASYFPIAFAIKTPIAIIALTLAGAAALALRRAPVRDPVLLTGLITFAIIYAAYIINSHLNIGHRHLLPLYPILFTIASASVGWFTLRIARWAVAATAAWLIAANIWICPHYLAYFNEFIGGPARGHLYLADSNIDWGQDLLRLADYEKTIPDAGVNLAYFGSALPTDYLPCQSLPSMIDFDPRAPLKAGTYVISATQLLGVYDHELRDAFWEIPRVRAAYADLSRIARAEPTPDETPEQRAWREQAPAAFREMQAKRLINRLRHEPPTARIGYSLFVYNLTNADIARLTQP